jgi:hypothetical protein
MRLQILSTEHWSLLASRNLAWNESFTRAGMYLSTLSFSAVALALVAQATDFGEGFRLFALVILPVVLVLGIGTQLRLDSANHHDVMCIIGMNRIRAKYVELAPDLEPLFVMGTNDDVLGVIETMAVVPGRGFLPNLLSATPVQISMLNAVLCGVIVALASIQVGLDSAATLALGSLTFLAALAIFAWTTRRLLRKAIDNHVALYPHREGPSAHG